MIERLWILSQMKSYALGVQCYGLCVQCYGLCVQKIAIRLLQLYSNLDILYSILPMWYWINYSLDMTCTVSHLTCTFLVKHFTLPFGCLVTWESFITKHINYYKTITHSNVWLLIQSRSTYMPLEEAINISFFVDTMLHNTTCNILTASP